MMRPPASRLPWPAMCSADWSSAAWTRRASVVATIVMRLVVIARAPGVQRMRGMGRAQATLEGLAKGFAALAGWVEKQAKPLTASRWLNPPCTCDRSRDDRNALVVLHVW